MYSLYCITNKINGKKYVGVTKKEPHLRINEHRRGQYDNLIAKAIKKYGWENFEWKILATTECNVEADNLEKQLINEHRTYYKNGHGYNMTYGGDTGAWKRDMSDEHKAKIKQALKGRAPSPEALEKAKQTRAKNKKEPWNKGKKLTEDQKKNMGPKKGRVPWNKGLTADLDPRVKENGQKTREARLANGTYVPWNKGLKTTS